MGHGPAHDGQIGRGHRSGQVVDAATTDPERFGLLGDRQIMGAVDHRFALSRPALLSAPDKKSLVSVSSPILACNVFTSTAGVAGSDLGSDPNTPAAPSRSCAFQAVIWLGWASNCCASSASVFSPLTAAKATFALKAGVWFRRGRLLIVSPALQPSWPLSGRNLYGAYWCQARNGKAGSFPTSHPCLRQPGFGSVHNDPRGTRHRAQTIAPHTCIRRIQRIQTMMQ